MRPLFDDAGVDVMTFLGEVGLLVKVLLASGNGRDGRAEMLGKQVVALVAAGAAITAPVP
jgi:hypothetical protein